MNFLEGKNNFQVLVIARQGVILCREITFEMQKFSGIRYQSCEPFIAASKIALSPGVKWLILFTSLCLSKLERNFISSYSSNSNVSLFAIQDKFSAFAKPDDMEFFRRHNLNIISSGEIQSILSEFSGEAVLGGSVVKTIENTRSTLQGSKAKACREKESAKISFDKIGKRSVLSEQELEALFGKDNGEEKR